MKTKKVAIFEGQKIRRHWDEEQELLYEEIVQLKLMAQNGKIKEEGERSQVPILFPWTNYRFA